ncbi:metallophosphoesterase [Chlorobaculum tepidum]|uniref:metallophosphoesterase n=1 Tax=Chlorobaculum tepidum TaxID=1097 RepID=UPI0002E5A4B2|nr:metallophosphoesterase [Chlorobaculum tepidum]
MIDHHNLPRVLHPDSGNRPEKPRRVDLLLVIASLLAALHLFPTVAFSEPGRLTVLFTSDLHSHFSPHHELADNGSIRDAGGYARLAGAIEQERKRTDGNTLLVDAGDFTQGTLYHTVLQEEALELRLMGAMGYDVATFSNHDFDFRPSGATGMLRAARAKAQVLPQLVISNLRSVQTTPAMRR